MPGEENRVHARIHVSTKIDVAGPDGLVEAELKDLSKGGARFHAPTAIGGVGDTLELFLPALDGSDIAVMAQVIRSDEAGGSHVVAVRFDAVEPAMAQSLSDLIELLLSNTSAPAGKEARAARRIEVHFGQLAELRGILVDISNGTLLMTIPEPLSLYEEVDVAVPDTSNSELLILHARVSHQRKLVRDGVTAYQVGLEFSQMRTEARRCVGELLRAVVEVLEPEAPKD
jgi:c-di-GMP-binding flagellar brake protein YcgR